MTRHVFISDCDACGACAVPGARGQAAGIDGFFCFPCRGDERDPYGIEEEAETEETAQ